MNLKLVLYFLILFVMSINGAWHLVLFLSPPKTGVGLGIWYWLYLIILPALGLLGIAALALKKPLNLSGWIGTLLLIYVGSLTLLPFLFSQVLSSLFAQGGFGAFHVMMFTITLIRLLVIMLRR